MENFQAAKFCDSSNSSGEESDYQLEQLCDLPKVTDGVISPEHTTATPAKRKCNREETKARLPTRRPDPNVYNRNALLARENRRKKKEHLESLEKSLQDCKRENAVLMEELKHQRKTMRRVEREKQYYKNIVKNRLGIAGIVAALNGRLRETRAAPVSSFSLNQTHDVASSPTRDSSYSRSGSSNYEPDYLAFDNFGSCSDNEFDIHCPITLEDSWHEQLNDKDLGLGSEPQSSEANTGILTNIINDHCYVNQKSDTDATLKEVGICLHLSAGKVSLEFCPACNRNANNSPPLQLLQENLAA